MSSSTCKGRTGVTQARVTRHAPLPPASSAIWTDVTPVISYAPPDTPSSPTTLSSPDFQCPLRSQTTPTTHAVPNTTVGLYTRNRNLRSPTLHPHPRSRPQGHRGLGVRHRPTTSRRGQAGNHSESRRGAFSVIFNSRSAIRYFQICFRSAPGRPR